MKQIYEAAETSAFEKIFPPLFVETGNWKQTICYNFKLANWTKSENRVNLKPSLVHCRNNIVIHLEVFLALFQTQFLLGVVVFNNVTSKVLCWFCYKHPSVESWIWNLAEIFSVVFETCQIPNTTLRRRVFLIFKHHHHEIFSLIEKSADIELNSHIFWGG